MRNVMSGRPLFEAIRCLDCTLPPGAARPMDSPAPSGRHIDSGQIRDSPAGFPESGRGYLTKKAAN
jgi:hypothetical protein